MPTPPTTPKKTPISPKRKSKARTSTNSLSPPFGSPQSRSSRPSANVPGGFASPFASPVSAGSHLRKKKVALPKNDEHFDVLVYVKPKSDRTDDESTSSLPSDPDKIQAIWADNTTTERSPSHIWAYYSIPKNIDELNVVYGVWGYKDGIDFSPSKNNLEDKATMESFAVEDMRFYGPNSKLPKSFAPRGVWTFPFVSHDISALKDWEAGFVALGDQVDKAEDLDVSGQWKVLYQKGGVLVEDEQGPGMKKRMKINIETPKGKTYIFTVKPDDTINAIKVRVQEKTNIPKNEQRLVFNGYDLDDPTKTLDDYNIVDEDTIQLKAPKMNVNVQDWNGNVFTLHDVESTESINDIKGRIKMTRSIPLHLQRLVYDDRPLRDGSKSLKDYGIKNEDTLKLLPMQLKIKKPSGKKVPIIINPMDTVESLKKKVAKEEGIPVPDVRLTFNGNPLNDDSANLDDAGIGHADIIDLHPMQIHVKDWDGGITTLNVSSNDTLNDVNMKIEQKLKVPNTMQRIRIENNRLMMDGTRTLDQYGVQHDDTLELLPMEVSVKTPEGKLVSLTVLPRETVRNLKEKVNEEEGIPIMEQRLKFMGNPLDDDRVALGDLGIVHGDTINMEGMHIHVKHWNGRKFTYDVAPNDSLEVVMDLIERQQKIPKNAQWLMFEGQQLKNKRKNLKEYGIHHDDTLKLLPMQVMVKSLDGKTIPLNVTPRDTIKDLKKKISEAEGTPVGYQRLRFGDKPIENPKDTLDDLGIGHGDVINLTPIQIHIKDWNDKIVSYHVSPSDSIGSIKDRVESKQNLPREHQRLFLEGEPLEKDDKTLEQCKIRHNDTLVLEPMKIHVKTMSGKKITMQVEPNDSVLELKTALQDKLNVAPDAQRLVFKDVELPNHQTLEECGIEHNDTIHLEGLLLWIRDPKGNMLQVDVEPNETIDVLKDKIRHEHGIPKNQQILEFQGQPLDNSRTLQDYNIRHKDTLDMMPMEIKIKTPSGKIIPITVKPTDSVRNVQKKLQKKENIPVECQELTLSGRPLNENLNLEDNGIGHGDVLDLEPMHLTVRKPDGSTFPIDADPTDTIQDLKENIEATSGIPKRHQRLCHGTSPLDDEDATLTGCGVRNNDTLDLEPMQIHAIISNGRKTVLTVDPDDTIEDIKQRLEDEIKTPVDIQEVEFQDKKLNDEQTLDEAGIKHDDRIHVRLVRQPEEKPQRKSYLPENWKEQRDAKYGTMVIKTYTMNHDEDGPLVRRFVSEERSDFQFDVSRGDIHKRKSMTKA